MELLPLIYFLKPDSNDQSLISSNNTVEKNNDAASHQQKKIVEDNSIPVQESVMAAPVEPTPEQTIPDTDNRTPIIEATVTTPAPQASLDNNPLRQHAASWLNRDCGPSQ